MTMNGSTYPEGPGWWQANDGKFYPPDPSVVAAAPPAPVPPSMARYQYRIVNLGMFNALERMISSFAALGADGWQLVATYDKASNWFQGMEKGFILFMREVPAGQEPVGPWASSFDANQNGDPTAGYNAW